MGSDRREHLILKRIMRYNVAKLSAGCSLPSCKHHDRVWSEAERVSVGVRDPRCKFVYLSLLLMMMLRMHICMLLIFGSDPPFRQPAAVAAGGHRARERRGQRWLSAPL